MIRRLKAMPAHLFEHFSRRVPRNHRGYPQPEIRIYVQTLHQELALPISIAWATNIASRRSGFTIAVLFWGLAITWNPARFHVQKQPDNRYTVTEPNTP